MAVSGRSQKKKRKETVSATANSIDLRETLLAVVISPSSSSLLSIMALARARKFQFEQTQKENEQKRIEQLFQLKIVQPGDASMFYYFFTYYQPLINIFLFSLSSRA